jgi:hypothetical protein
MAPKKSKMADDDHNMIETGNITYSNNSPNPCPPNQNNRKLISNFSSSALNGDKPMRTTITITHSDRKNNGAIQKFQN